MAAITIIILVAEFMASRQFFIHFTCGVVEYSPRPFLSGRKGLPGRAHMQAFSTHVSSPPGSPGLRDSKSINAAAKCNQKHLCFCVQGTVTSNQHTD